MLVFDEGCIRSDIWKIKHEKWEKTQKLGTFRRVLPVEYRYWSFLAKFYR